MDWPALLLAKWYSELVQKVHCKRAEKPGNLAFRDVMGESLSLRHLFQLNR